MILLEAIQMLTKQDQSCFPLNLFCLKKTKKDNASIRAILEIFIFLTTFSRNT